LIIPWQVDVPSDRHPVMNWLIAAGIVAVFILQIATVMEHQQNHPRAETVQDRIMPGPAGGYVLQGWSIKGLLGHMWLHGGFIHILGNLLFLWIFGNAVCSKIGNLMFLPLYIFFGLMAAGCHLIFSGTPMLGASGAIFGVVGMYLVFFPENDITCYWVWWLFLIPRVVEFTVSSYWMILFWFAWDLAGAFIFNTGSGGGVAHFAHLGGFVAGFAVAIMLLKIKLVVMEPRYEKSLLEFIGGMRNKPEPEPDRLYGGFQRDLEYVKSQELQRGPVQITPFEEPAAARVETAAAPDTERKIRIDKPADEFIRFVCSCGKKVRIPAKFAGKTGRCPACKQQIQIPYPA